MNSTTLYSAGNELLDLTTQLLEPMSPYNPQPIFKHYWEAMTDRYTEYQIATTGSLLVQIIFYFGCSLPGFIFQFLSFMKYYKVQKNKAHTLYEQWVCLRRVLFSKSFIYVSDTAQTQERNIARKYEWLGTICRIIDCI